MQTEIVQTCLFLVLGVFLVQAQQGHGSPERSIADADYAKAANYIMKTAMKLPPHILPTLEQLDTKGKRRVINKQLGVYMPEKRKPLGIYIPRATSREEPSQSDFIVVNRPSKKIHRPQVQDKKSQKQPDLPTFTLPVDTRSPVLKFLGIGGNNDFKKLERPVSGGRSIRPQAKLAFAASERKHQSNNVQEKGAKVRGRLRGRARPRQQLNQEGYKFEKPGVIQKELEHITKDVPKFRPLSGDRIVTRPTQANADRREGPKSTNEVEKYVPTFMKEVLAKSFLKDPERYLARLRARERAKKLRKQQEQQQAVAEDRASRPPPPSPTIPLHLTPTESTLTAIDVSHTKPSQISPVAQLQFDSNFPWNPNSYDNQYEDLNTQQEETLFQTNPQRRRFQPQQQIPRPGSYSEQTRDVVEDTSPAKFSRTICICCDGDERRKKRSSRMGRTLKIENPRQSARVYKHQDFIRRSLDCINQEPIEVVLVFNEKKSTSDNAQRKVDDFRESDSYEVSEVQTPDSSLLDISERNWEQSRKRKRKKISKPFIDEIGFDSHGQPSEDILTEEYYDPTKLSFIFSTPSPLVKKSSQLQSLHEDTETHRAPYHSFEVIDPEDSGHVFGMKEDVEYENEDIDPTTRSGDSEEEKALMQKMEALMALAEDLKLFAIQDEVKVSESQPDLSEYEYEDNFLQASANIPIAKNNLQQSSPNYVSENVSELTERYLQELSTEVKGKDKSQLEEVYFPAQLRHDVSHVTESTPTVRERVVLPEQVSAVDFQEKSPVVDEQVKLTAEEDRGAKTSRTKVDTSHSGASMSDMTNGYLFFRMLTG